MDSPDAKNTNPVVVGIVEDTAGPRAKLKKHIEEHERVGIAHAWPGAEQCLADDRHKDVDAFLLDIGLPGMSGIDLCARLSASRPEVPILMLTSFADSSTVFQAIKAGATGYLLKSEIDDILPSLMAALEGGSPMTPTIALQVVKYFHGKDQDTDNDTRKEQALSLREQDVLRMLAAGAQNRRIATEMHISENTVKYHIKNIYRKLHVANRAALMEAALRRGLV